jgi:hypothetical protein
MASKPSSPVNARIGAELLALWEKGTSLKAAPFRFGDTAVIQRYNALTPRGGLVGSLLSGIASTTGHAEDLPPDMRRTKEEFQEFSSLSNQIYDSFRARVIAGEFLILGFASPRHPADYPYHVPKDLWIIGSLNIDSDKAQGQGLQFEAVRILPASLHKAEPPPKPSPGRPSSRALIKLAYDRCRADGLIDFNAPQVRAIESVQVWLKAHRPEEFGSGRGFATEAIRKAIRDDFAKCADKL